MQILNSPQLSIFKTSTISNAPTPIETPTSINSQPSNIFDPLKNAFNEIFPQNLEENTVIKMRRALGDKGTGMSDEQIQCITTEFQFLIDAWFDDFEKDIFSGMTLKEVLNEK